MSLIVRGLTNEDEEQVAEMDELAGQSLGNWLNEPGDEEPYCYGAIKDGNLIAYCSLGYADCFTAIEEHELWTQDAKLLSDVYVKREHRHQGVAKLMLSEVLKEHSLTYLTVLYPKLANLYRQIGFSSIDEEDYVMVRSVVNA